MADVSKTVELIFETTDNTGNGLADVQKKIDDLAKAGDAAAGTDGGLAKLEGAINDADKAAKDAVDGKIGEFAEKVKAVADNSNAAKTGLDKVKDALDNAKDKFEGPQQAAEDLETKLLALARPGTGAIAVFAAALATLTLAGLASGKDQFDFETLVGNITGSGQRATAEWKFIRDEAGGLYDSVSDVSQAYADFIVAVSGKQYKQEDIQDTFLGFSKLFDSVGGSAKDAKGPAKDFLEAISDDNLDAEELDSLASKVPGFLDTFAKSLDEPIEKIKEMAENGELNNEEIQKFKDYLVNGFTYDSLNPVKGAFKDLWDEIKRVADDLGADSLYMIALKAIEKSVEAITFTIAASAGFVDLFGGSLANLAYTVKNWDWGGFVDRQNELFDKFSARVKLARDELFGLNGRTDSTVKAGEKAGEAIGEGAETAKEQVARLKKEAKETSDAFKDLGVEQKAAADSTGLILNSFNKLLSAPNTDGGQILQGLAGTLTRLTDDENTPGTLNYLRATLEGAFSDGKISASQFSDAMKLVDLRASGAIKNTKVAAQADKDWAQQTKDLAKAKDEEAKKLKKVEDTAAKSNIELEKIASNERIKTYEAKIKLDISNVEANAKIAVSIIEGISKTYDANIGLIRDVLGQVGDGYSAADKARLAIVDDANKRVNELHKAQLDIIAAQAEYLRAKSASLYAGNPLVTIKGDGLAPHLEAIMWEIFSKIQVRMAFDGGDTLMMGV